MRGGFLQKSNAAMYIVPVIKVKQGQVILAIKKKSPKQLCESHYDILRRFVVRYYKITTHVAPSHKHTEFLFCFHGEGSTELLLWETL